MVVFLLFLSLPQALIELGCVTKKTLAKSPKPSLFTRPAQQRKSEREGERNAVMAVVTTTARLTAQLNFPVRMSHLTHG